MSPKKAFLYYYGLHLHFVSEKYSILKYGPNTESARNKYDGLSESRKYRFSWMYDKFQTVQNITYAVIASELSDLDCAFSPKEEILSAYFKYKSRRESISYFLTKEFDTFASDPLSDVQLLFTKQYSPEFILIQDTKSNFLSHYLDDSSFSFSRQKILKLIKYKDFFPVQKYTRLLNHENTISA